MSDNKELIWVTKEQAAQFKELDTVEHQSKVATEIVRQKGLDIESELNQLDDDLIRFKAACLVHKSEMEKVYTEQADKLEALINNCWDVMPVAKDNAQKMADELQPFADKITDLSVSINEVKKLTQGINFYGIEQLTKLVEQVNYMDKNSKDIFTFLINNYKTE